MHDTYRKIIHAQQVKSNSYDM